MSTAIPLPSILPSERLFRVHLRAVVHRYGADGICVLDDGSEVCPHCCRKIAFHPLWRIRHHHALPCETCGRILVNSHTQHQALLATFSPVLAGAPSPAL